MQESVLSVHHKNSRHQTHVTKLVTMPVPLPAECLISPTMPTVQDGQEEERLRLSDGGTKDNTFKKW